MRSGTILLFLWPQEGAGDTSKREGRKASCPGHCTADKKQGGFSHSHILRAAHPQLLECVDCPAYCIWLEAGSALLISHPQGHLSQDAQARGEAERREAGPVLNSPQTLMCPLAAAQTGDIHLSFGGNRALQVAAPQM